MASLKLTHALLTCETQKDLSLPVAALILGAVSQAKTVMEMVDRVCDQRLRAKVAGSPVAAVGQELQTVIPR
jgi:hypothetical protein